MSTATPSKTKGKKVKQPIVKVTLSTFDDSGSRPIYRSLREGIALKDFTPISIDEYSPTGMTPLLDATVEFIEHQRKLAKKDEVVVGLLLDESGSMASVRETVVESINKFVDGLRIVKKVDPKTAGTGFLVIATDGYENASKRHSYEELRMILKKCENDGWVTIFLGAGIDGWGQGHALGFSGSAHGQTVSTVPTARGYNSALMAASADSAEFLSDRTSYVEHRATTGMRSITEAGDELDKNIGGPSPVSSSRGGAQFVAPASPFDPTEALGTVTNSLEE